MLYVAIVPEPPRSVIVPTGPKSSVTQRTLPSGRFTSLTWTDRRLKPPQPLKRVSSAVAWPLGVLPLNTGPLRDSFRVPPVWQPGGLGGGGSVTVRVNAAERVPVAVGENVIETLQLVPGASVRPEQPSLTLVKSSVFGTAALLMKSPALPVFVTVIDCGELVVPIAWSANVSAVGVNATAGAAVM